MNVYEMMTAGQPVSAVIIEAKINHLEGEREDYAERGMLKMVERTDAFIKMLRTYKPTPKKPRDFKDIQADIDTAQKMAGTYSAGRNYKYAAEWKQNCDEYQKEFEEAAEGRVYMPVVTHGGSPVESKGKGVR
jgi:hypothetical protein